MKAIRGRHAARKLMAFQITKVLAGLIIIPINSPRWNRQCDCGVRDLQKRKGYASL